MTWTNTVLLLLLPFSDPWRNVGAFVPSSVSQMRRRSCCSVDCERDRMKRNRKQERGFVVVDPLFLVPQQLGTFEQLSVTPKDRNVAIYDWSENDPVSFHDAWDFQKSLVQSHLERLSTIKDGQKESSQFYHLNDKRETIDSGTKGGFDSVVLLQHEPVYTLGTGSDPSFIRDQEKVDIVRMDRGGEVTYHGPGQLVVYPILDLREYRQDIHWYMRALEESILLALEYAGANGATREEDVTGVWVQNEKVAAIGIKARRWVTMHGLAVNVEESSLSNFDGIVPCGLEGRGVTCVSQHLDKPITVPEFAVHMKAALEHVFRFQLVPAVELNTKSDPSLIEQVS